MHRLLASTPVAAAAAEAWQPRGPQPSRAQPQAARSPLAALVGAAASLVLLAQPAAAAVDAEASFAKNCAGCHAGGGNVVQGGASLFQQDLQRNGAASPEAIYSLIYSGKGKMPGYGKDCAPRGKCTFAARLPDEEIQGLTDYTLRRASEGWK